MPTYNFKEQFVPFVKDRSKRQTVRAYRKDGRLPELAQSVNLFSGMRTKHCKRIATEFVEACATIYIYENGEMYIGSLVPEIEAEFLLRHKTMYLLSNYTVKEFNQKEKNEFAWRDGFRPERSSIEFPGEAFALMLSFWKSTHSLPFAGTVTYW
ncbi:MAG: hypothetical protein ABIQ31_18555 [Ferruginibacter sp.]